MNPFAYLFERFPAATQTFCYREAIEMARLLRNAPGTPAALGIYAMRHPDRVPGDFPSELLPTITYLPDTEGLRAPIRKARAKGALPPEQEAALQRLKSSGDRRRIEEALWIGPDLQRRGIIHVHAHFAGIAARTAYWLKRFFGITYSFTGHANDIFCETDFPVSLSDLITEALAVVTETDYSRDWLREHYPGQKEKFHRVYNGIDLSSFPTEPAPPCEGIHLVSVGRCVEKKGFPDFVEACRLLRASGLEFTASIVGGGPLEEPLREQISAAGLGAIVRLTGPQPQEVVRDEIRRASLFVLACCEEADGGMDNFPTVITEAMASFLPVVSTTMAGVPELVEHGVTGLLSRPRDPAGLADAIRSVLDGNPREMGLRGRQRIESLLPISRTAGELRAIITQALRSRNQPA